jgi:hypothetical protein
MLITAWRRGSEAHSIRRRRHRNVGAERASGQQQPATSSPSKPVHDSHHQKYRQYRDDSTAHRYFYDCRVWRPHRCWRHRRAVAIAAHDNLEEGSPLSA